MCFFVKKEILHGNNYSSLLVIYMNLVNIIFNDMKSKLE